MAKVLCIIMLFLTNNIFAASAWFESSMPIPTVIKASKRAVISSPMSGLIIKLPFKDGTEFEKGDVLAAFDCDIEVSTLKKFSAILELSKRKLSSNQRLMRLGSISHYELHESQAQFQRSQADVEIALKKVSHCQIIAPYDGHMIILNVHKHESVQLYHKLFIIYNSDELRVNILLPSKWLKWVKVGTNFRIYIKETDRNYKAKVIRVIHKIDAVSQTVKVIAKISIKSHNLKPGMSGLSYFSHEPHEKK